MPVLMKILILLTIGLGAWGLTAVSGFGLIGSAALRVFKRLPGAEAYEDALIQKFEAIKKARGKNYRPRARHAQPDGWPIYTNRLFLETSPYLLQHAHNPVDWYPWGKDAFAAAQRLDRPVLLSVGYSPCHWCHVMEAESFEDIEIARYLNENYIAIKVDREERPDIDALYMNAVLILTGQGGWPLNVWLTPDQKPFYGGTYFPGRDGDRGVNIGFLTLLKRLNETYRDQRERVASAGREVSDAIQRMLSTSTDERLPDETALHRAAAFYKDRYDGKYGGLKGPLKFPSSLPVRLLLRYSRRTGDSDVLEMVRHSIKNMACGGIYDHVGGGFHRYATDERWRVPHFEKMLYDNALLAMAYSEAYQATGDEGFKRIVEEILNYVKRDMTSAEGGFYSATDADSITPDGRMAEGYFYTWTPKEIEEALGKDRAAVVQRYFSVTPAGNFEGRNILHTSSSDFSKKGPNQIILESRERLYQTRNLRPRPLRDEKILTAWNGLMISAFARAGFVLNDAGYTGCAERAARFVLDHLYPDNRLYRSYKDNTPRHDAYLEDYAFFIAALIDLYETTHEIRWLQRAIDLDGHLKKHHEDQKNGGFFMTGALHENLIARGKPYEDGAIPSGNAIAVLNLLRLATYTLKDAYRKRAEKTFRSFYKPLQSIPSAMSEMLCTVDYYLDSPFEIIIVTPEGRKKDADRFLDQLRSRFIPNRMIMVVSEQDINMTAPIVPAVTDKAALNGKTTAFVCKKGVCGLPTTDPETFAGQLQDKKYA